MSRETRTDDSARITDARVERNENKSREAKAKPFSERLVENLERKQAAAADTEYVSDEEREVNERVQEELDDIDSGNRAATALTLERMATAKAANEKAVKAANAEYDAANPPGTLAARLARSETTTEKTETFAEKLLRGKR